MLEVMIVGASYDEEAAMRRAINMRLPLDVKIALHNREMVLLAENFGKTTQAMIERMAKMIDVEPAEITLKHDDPWRRQGKRRAGRPR